MALVEYSDSEGSASESEAPQASAAPKPQHSAPGKSGFKKVVDTSGSNKIRVSLPVASEKDGPADEEQDRPAKRARTGGASSGFNSMLPAPKNAATSKGPASLSKSRATGLKQGVSLKTGATPAFSRNPPPEFEDDVEPEAPAEEARVDDFDDNPRTDTAAPEPLPEIAVTVKPMMFKPLSVGKKNTKKKKIPETKTSDKSDVATSTATSISTTAAPPKPKQSLFSTLEPETTSTATISSNGTHYQPLFDENAEDESTEPDHPDHSSMSNVQTQQQPQDLSALADSLNLSAAERRQLFGRKGNASGVGFSNFSVAAEYKNNNDMLASGENDAPVHNPVKGITPGKHSLQQLLNAAHSQKDALEESFAQGKRNKQAAGSKYGW